MAIKVIAQRREVKLGKNPGLKFVMRPDLYVPIQVKKVFEEASAHSGISVGALKASWDAAGEVIRAWATEGHSVPLPGLGTMRFGVRAKAVEDLEDVKANLISTRRIIFTPSVDMKDELKKASSRLDWQKAREDVEPFIHETELASLQYFNAEYFMQLADHLVQT